VIVSTCKNISEHSKDGFKRELPASFRIEEVDDQDMDSDCCVHFECHEAHLVKNYMLSVEKKQAIVEQVRSLAKEGFLCR